MWKKKNLTFNNADIKNTYWHQQMHADIEKSRKMTLKNADIKTTLDRLTLKHADIKNTLEKWH